MEQREMILIPKGGRPKKEYPSGFFEAILKQYETSTAEDLAKAYHVSVATMYRYIRRARKEQNVKR